MNFIRFLSHLILVVFLTLLTQIGGFVWLLNALLFRLRKKKSKRYIRFASFVIIYLAFTLFIVPILAPLTGRTALPLLKKGELIPHNFITPLLNRNYVTLGLENELLMVAKKVNNSYPELKLSYLDANFPFIDGFPLLPHRSHDDGRKVDLSFYYTKNGKLTNQKPSRSGYGNYVSPRPSEWNQTNHCLKKGHWQYDITKYVTLGTRNNLEFADAATKSLLLELLRQKKMDKIFIEPHLKTRLNLNHNRIRFHGCYAVRHDDHIHYQIQK